MPSPAFGTQSTAGGSSAANVTINVPASTANGDFLLTAISRDSIDAIGNPAGWTEIVDDTANTFHLWVGWRIASSEPANYTWTFAADWRDAVMQRYTGVINSAPLDPASPAAPTTTASANTVTTPSNNIATAATRVVAIHTSETLTSWSAATATVDAVTMTVHTSTGAVEVHVMSGAKAAAATPEAGKAQAFSGPAGPMKGYMLVLASVSAGASSMLPSSPVMRRLPIMAR